MPASYEGVVGGKVGAAGKAEYDLDTLRLQTFHQRVNCPHLPVLLSCVSDVQ